ncbi:peptidase family M3 protein [Cardiosporidium cionae]|uniref:Peptidase family M3 protein n=1 Tax=Cardiosporidium cionae TaxID=476202 RepID=A0ABQ7J7J0_9APIC|nr:peptidase family M3 protein [Cardiosporidium cionae]|eukprot:KAF8819670.1 peptidase family M3 protein [Cardiosporidium cionae]
MDKNVPCLNGKKSSRVMGILYIDLWNRPNKSPLMAQYTIRCSKKMDFCYEQNWLKETPLTLILRNDVDGKLLDSLLKTTTLSPPNVLMFYHEMGHTMHSLISSTEFQHLSGTRGAVDFAEFPSHLFELFFQSSSFPASLMPSSSSIELSYSVENYLRFQRRFSHLDALHLLLQAEMDQRSASLNPLYTTKSVENHIHSWFSTSSLLNQSFPSTPGALPLYALMGVPPPSQFTHLLHYGGTYYAYLYCKVSSSFVWEKAFQRSCWNATAGRELRKVLEKGCLDCTIHRLLHLVEACHHFDETVPPINFSEIKEFPQKIPLEPFLRDIQWKE